MNVVTYIARFATRGHTVSIHAQGCEAARASRQFRTWEVQAETPEGAADIVRDDEDADPRGITVKCCPCCKPVGDINVEAQDILSGELLRIDSAIRACMQFSSGKPTTFGPGLAYLRQAKKLEALRPKLAQFASVQS